MTSGTYTRCETNGCRKKAMTGRPYRHCKPHALVRAFELLKPSPSLMWAICQVVEFEVERKVREINGSQER